MLRIPKKYEGYNKGKSAPEPKPEGTVMNRLLARLKWEKEVIQPMLGNLFPCFKHSCIIFISGEYVGQGYGTYDRTDEEYDQAGQILAKH
jgi:hypothetical protein